MPLNEWIAQYGALVVFLNVLGASLGMPIPVIPTLIAVGASYAVGATGAEQIALRLLFILSVAVLAGALADLLWFRGGRRYGARTLGAVCSLTLSRDACVSKTEKFFGLWGVRLLIVARFIPGLSLVAVPLCGAMAVPLRTFLWYDSAGLALWAACGLMLGACFATKIQMLLHALSAAGAQALAVAAAILLLSMIYRYARHTHLAKAARQARQEQR